MTSLTPEQSNYIIKTVKSAEELLGEVSDHFNTDDGVYDDPDYDLRQLSEFWKKLRRYRAYLEKTLSLYGKRTLFEARQY